MSETVSVHVNPQAINVKQDTNSSAINVKPMDTILSALNVYTDTSIAIPNKLLVNQCQHILGTSNRLSMSHRDTSVAIKQALNRSMPNLKA